MSEESIRRAGLDFVDDEEKLVLQGAARREKLRRELDGSGLQENEMLEVLE